MAGTEKKLNLNVNPYLKYALTFVLLSFFSYLVLQVDVIRDTYPIKFVTLETYKQDKESLQKQVSSIKAEQLEQRKLTQFEFSNLRSEMNSGFRETRELIITLNNEKEN